MAASSIHRFVLGIQSTLFVAVLIVGGELSFMLPQAQVSVEEKRKLTPLPAVTVDGLASGAVFDQFDAYYADHFIFRDFFIDLAARIKAARGIAHGEIEVYDAPDGAAQPEVVGANAVPPPPAEDLNAPYESIRSVIVTRGRAVQIFGGSDGMVEPFAAMINRYHQLLGPDVTIYCMAVPVGSDMFLPTVVNKGVMKEKRNIDHLYSKLDPAIVSVNAYDALLAHRNEYIQFHTDHHWTGLGAYYAYTAFAQRAGFQPLPLNGFTYKDIPDFLGTLYYRTRDATLKERGDHVEVYMVPGETRTTAFDKGFENGSPWSLYYENAKGSNAYGVFLGGDRPLLRVVTGNRSGRKIVVVKDSYGNAFSPYLAAHYDEVFIVDFRYFDGKIPDLMKRYGVKELLFAHNVFAANTATTVTRETGMLE